MCIVTKKDFTESILVVIIFLTSLSETIQERKNSLQFLVGSCLVSIVFRHVRSTPKERSNNHKVVAERGCCVNRRGSCCVQGPARVNIV